MKNTEEKLESAISFIENIIRYGAMGSVSDGQKCWALLKELDPDRAKSLIKELERF
tara:strand:- start:7743 stop:7910 length:168 start_codon:yes stop_codon:yes gene_type:complete